MANGRYYTFAPGKAPKGRAGDALTLAPGQKVGFRSGKGYFALPASTDKPPAAATPQPLSSLDPRVAPYLQPQLDLIEQNKAAAQQALKSFTSAILNEIKGYGAGTTQDYDQAIQQQNGLATAAANSLRDANPDSQIQSILQAAGAPAAQGAQVTDALRNAFSGGAAGIQGTQGLMAGGRLLADKAAAQAFSNTLPTIAGLAGTQGLKNLLYGYGQQEQQVLGQAPTILNQLQQQDTAAQTAANEAAYKKSYLDYLGQSLGVKAAGDQARIKVSQQNADTAVYNANTQRQRAIDAANAAAARIQIQRQNATTAAKKAKASGAKAPTGDQLSKLVDQWFNGKTSTVRTPVLDADKKPKLNPSTGVPITVPTTRTGGKLSYQQAYRRLLALHVPEVQARALLNTRFARGERGRPWLGIAERQTLQAAKVKPTALYYKGHAYLNPAQVQALRSASLLPAGEVANGRYFIAPGY